jgi:two-component system sensor histidine kinase MprB
MSFRRRLVLLSAAGTALAVAGSAFAVYVLVRRQLHNDVTERLEARAQIHGARGFANIRELRPLEGAALPEPPILPRLISADGRVLAARYPRLRYPISADARAVAAGERRSASSDVRFRDERFKVLTVRAGPRRALQLAESLKSVEETLDELLLVLVSVAGAGMLAAPVVGLLVAGGGLRPVRRLTRAAEDIARTGDLEYRIDIAQRDELGSLAESFNAMVDRLAGMVDTVERARRAQRQLVADASHELRTPIASLRANVELLALSSGNGAERDELVSDIVQQLDGLTTLVAQLIELAREELLEPERTPVALDELVDEALGRTRQNHPRVEFAAELEQTTVLGARESLARAVTNLLDNAAKWSPEGGRVDVRLRHGALEVRDHGPGIDEADLPYVFERFYRSAAARDRPGSGLGLAIVAQVVSSHGGDVRAEHAPGGGALMTARFPSAVGRSS